MEDKIIVKALKFPHKYPWKKDFDLNIKEIDKVLEKNNLDTEEKRRLLAADIRFNILKECKVRNTIQQVMNEVKCNKSINVSNYVIKKMMNRLSLEKEEDLINYKNMFKGNIQIHSEDEKFYIDWLVEIIVYDYCLKNNIDIEKIIKEIENKLLDLNIIMIKKYDLRESINNSLRKSGFSRKNNLKIISKALEKYREDFENTFGSIVQFKSNSKKDLNNNDGSIEVNLTDSILDAFDCMPDTSEEELKVKSKKLEEVKNFEEVKEINKEIYVDKNQEEEQVNNKSEDSIYLHLSGLANELGYKVVNKDNITLSKNEYDLLVLQNEEESVEILKKLAVLETGAILSELYNAYKDINNISKENLEAILSNLFTNLKINGFEVMEEEGYVGQDIKVNPKNILKEFKFDREIDIKEEVEGKIRYLGWSYKGKRVVPMIITPKNK